MFLRIWLADYLNVSLPVSTKQIPFLLGWETRYSYTLKFGDLKSLEW